MACLRQISITKPPQTGWRPRIREMKAIAFVAAFLLSGKFVCVESGLLDRSQAYKGLFNSNEPGHDQG